LLHTYLWRSSLPYPVDRKLYLVLFSLILTWDSNPDHLASRLVCFNQTLVRMLIFSKWESHFFQWLARPFLLVVIRCPSAFGMIIISSICIVTAYFSIHLRKIFKASEFSLTINFLYGMYYIVYLVMFLIKNPLVLHSRSGLY
jgi:hypothetical protein